MSTNAKDVITQESVTIIRNSKREVDRALRAALAEMEKQKENTLVRDTPLGRVQNVLKLYSGIKPLLQAVSTLPVVPRLWQTGIAVFIETLDGLATASFKAGKDL